MLVFVHKVQTGQDFTKCVLTSAFPQLLIAISSPGQLPLWSSHVPDNIQLQKPDSNIIGIDYFILKRESNSGFLNRVFFLCYAFFCTA